MTEPAVGWLRVRLLATLSDALHAALTLLPIRREMKHESFCLGSRVQIRRITRSERGSHAVLTNWGEEMMTVREHTP